MTAITPQDRLYRNVPADNLALAQRDYPILAAYLRHGTDIEIKSDPIGQRWFISASPQHQPQGYSFSTTRPVLTPAPLPVYTSPEARNGIYVSIDTPRPFGYIGTFAVVSLPYDFPRPAGFDVVHNPTRADPNHWLMYPTAEHTLLVHAENTRARYVDVVATTPVWHWEGMLKLTAPSQAPDKFEEGMDGAAHKVAARLHDWQILAADEDADLFDELGALQELLRDTRYTRLAPDLLHRCIAVGRRFRDLHVSVEDVDEFFQLCDGATA